MELRKKKCTLIILITVCLWIYLTFKSSPSCDNNVSKKEVINDNDKVINAGNLIFTLNRTTNVYEIDSKPVIWVYWHDDQLPDYVEILIQAIICINPTFTTILVHNRTVGNFWRTYPKDVFLKLSPAHQSDVFRVHVLKTFGGVYLDVDTFPVSTLAPFYDLLINHHLVGTNWTPMQSELSVGHLGPTRANITLFNVWAYWQDWILDGKAARLRMPNNIYPLQWSELLSEIATPLVYHINLHKLMRYFQLGGLETVGQLVAGKMADDVIQPLHSVYGRLKLLKWTPLLYFHNSKQTQLQSLNAERLLNSSNETVFGFFVKCAFMKCSDEKKVETKLKKLKIDLIEVMKEFKKFSVLYKCVL